MSSESSEEGEADNNENIIEPLNRQARVHRQRRHLRVFFDVAVSDREFREKHRVSTIVLEHLVAWIGPELARRNNRGLPLSPRQRIQVFLHFLGTNGFYHDVASSHVITRTTVCNIVHEVCNVLFEHRNEVIFWPDNPEKLAEEFYKIERIPCVAGRVVDPC